MRVVLQKLLVGLISGVFPVVVLISFRAPSLVASSLLWGHVHLALVGMQLIWLEKDRITLSLRFGPVTVWLAVGLTI